MESRTPEALLANTQLQEVIEQAFQALPSMQRAAISVVDMEGYKIDEVSNILPSLRLMRECCYIMHVLLCTMLLNNIRIIKCCNVKISLTRPVTILKGPTIN